MQNVLRACLIGAVLAGVVGCGGSYASRARTRYVAAHGIVPQAAEIRVADFLADYTENFPNPGPTALGLHIEGAHAAWATESPERLFVVQTAVRGRDADVRPPVSMMLIVDRSGSMRDEDKMTYVREALHRLVEQLSPADSIGITAFDDRADVILPVTQLSYGTGTVHQAIDTLHPRGSTNLSQGLDVGYRTLYHTAPEGALRRVILLTDAMANVGDTDIRNIADYARQGDEAGISLSAIGVGLAHEDEVLVRMADAGNGNHHFLDSPQRISRVFEQEISGLLEDVADSVRIAFTPAPGVSIVSVDGVEAEPSGAHHFGDLGRIGAGQHRVVMWTLRGVDANDPNPAVGRFTLDYIDVRNDREPQRIASAARVYTVTDPAVGTVVRNATIAWMARDLRAVSQLAHGGHGPEAWTRFTHIDRVVRALAVARPQDSEIAEDVTMLRDFGTALERQSGRHDWERIGRARQDESRYRRPQYPPIEAHVRVTIEEG